MGRVVRSRITLVILFCLVVAGFCFDPIKVFKIGNIVTEANGSSPIDYPKPLLVTKWGQDQVYARFTPGNELTGCWSTAIAQILYFHRLKPKGKVEYMTRTGYVIKENIGQYDFKWEQFFNNIEYGQTENQKDQVGKYIYFTACVIGKNFGGNNYMLDGDSLAQKLSEHYDCTATWYSREDYSQEVIKKTIIRELKDKRPLMMYFEGSNNGHAVVVDGYKISDAGEFIIHINMGYKGRDNGWYNYNDPIQDFDTLGIREIITITTKQG